MTEIHMDMSGVQQVRQGLSEVRTRIRDRIQQLRSVNQNLNSDWISNSADEYLEYYQEVESRLTRIADQIENLSSALRYEIYNFEEMDRTFGS